MTAPFAAAVSTKPITPGNPAAVRKTSTRHTRFATVYVAHQKAVDVEPCQLRFCSLAEECIGVASS